MTGSAAGETGASLHRWRRRDGSVIDCREKLRVLQDNWVEIEQVMRDCFDDAVLMEVDPEAMRALLRAMVDGLRDPRRGGVAG